MADTINAVKIADIVVDEDSGEIISWPEGIADIPARLMFLTAKKRECTEQEGAWKSRGAFLGGLARELMEAQGIDRFTSETGRLLIQTRETKTVDLDKLWQLAHDREVAPRYVEAAILASVTAVDADRIATCLGDVATDATITRSTTFIVAKAAPKPAEKPQKVEVTI